ncbi:MgtC/SapB family protein [Paenibacillus sp. N5-1-1-5]|uniref:MgtC/SapB family protein n=2 Tax=Paenibacillus radicis (ex Xue et al. 2023) TaxID=2972489 RepID=A0ABT1YGC5_9BACL|nr:MgtC/SapB family protein [Paenibacillus radicis (ex Xue et al. 2023)]MCR8632252.1 MgtC/SapB family protein [Paenibacillus radicis (ex Xue et al. 2023)]
MMQYEYLLRVILAGICGALVGYERKNRMKEAGIRTHFVVALGACLMMVISKYGFQDQNGWDNVAFDPSRIAAQVVSGVGFLGAGMIFMQRQTIKGLTTAAGIWATAGVGMAIGAGLYILGGGVTLIILLAQKLLHGRFNWLASPKTEQLIIRLTNETGATYKIQQLLEEKNITILSFHAESNGIDSDELMLEMIVRFPGSYRVEQLLPIVQEASFVRAVELK